MRTDKTAPRTIDEFIAGFPTDVREILQKDRPPIWDCISSSRLPANIPFRAWHASQFVIPYSLTANPSLPWAVIRS